MALTNLELATRTRNLISEKSPATTNITIPHLQALIPTAMEAYVRKVMSDREKREFLQKAYSIPLVAGALDLTNYTNGTSGRISLNELRNDVIYVTVAGESVPMTWVSSAAQLKYGRYPSDFPAVLLDGYFISTRNTDGSLTSLGTAPIAFTVTNYPSGASDFPLALVGDFILFLSDVAMREKTVDLATR